MKCSRLFGGCNAFYTRIASAIRILAIDYDTFHLSDNAIDTTFVAAITPIHSYDVITQLIRGLHYET